MTGLELRHKIEQAGYSLTDIASLIGISPQNLQNKLNNQDVKVGFLKDLAKAINKSIYYFLEADEKNVNLNVNPIVNLIGQKELFDQAKKEVSGLHPGITGPRRENIMLVPVKARAGYLAGYGDREYIEQLEMFAIPGCTNGSYRMFELEGESMYPTLSGGDFVVGRSETDCFNIKEGAIYIIVSRAEGIIIKRVLNVNKTAGKLVLGSDNPSYKPIELDCATVAEMWRFYCLVTTLPGEQDPEAIRLRNLEYEVADIKRLLSPK